MSLYLISTKFKVGDVIQRKVKGKIQLYFITDYFELPSNVVEMVTYIYQLEIINQPELGGLTYVTPEALDKQFKPVSESMKVLYARD